MNMLERMRAESLVNAPLNPHESEFQRFIEAHKAMCIPHMVSWHLVDCGGLSKSEWQEILDAEGYNVTAHACFFVEVGDLQHVFATGEAYWTVNPKDPEDCDQHRGWGPTGVFMLIRNKTTGEIIPRTLGSHTGVQALAQLYRFPVQP